MELFNDVTILVDEDEGIDVYPSIKSTKCYGEPTNTLWKVTVFKSAEDNETKIRTFQQMLQDICVICAKYCVPVRVYDGDDPKTER